MLSSDVSFKSYEKISFDSLKNLSNAAFWMFTANSSSYCALAKEILMTIKKQLVTIL